MNNNIKVNEATFLKGGFIFSLKVPVSLLKVYCANNQERSSVVSNDQNNGHDHRRAHHHGGRSSSLKGLR
ncbi:MULTISPECIES: hypothetical protein [unclassified Serratia (in: enterobacteria)]|uniref:hypothetical protein n=1 Tax=unclassified Serratia (in: enterobacteria) TaxID=2647522 RepID=UPI0030767829